ncbi:TrkH family potassium uptake protein [Micromonospora echinofusca]|uniref:TrkH family potassium uptake protein n=1 Tax=Micromonospora echinofusca TaxID=47858 RepID=A0ABS3VTB9_MICEH|nr:potassium transporter TrkG [Micromonospora echinofusca]MBO4207802.1 TrkH family potassium uptake protein [Micromonospora echinofusca]
MRRALRHPVRLVPLAFLAAIALGTAVLMMPVCWEQPGPAPLLTALFTATSAVSVTGLSAVDTRSSWSDPGLVMITLLTQLGGFGILALASLLGLVVSQRLNLRNRALLAAESAELARGDVRWLLLRIAQTVLVTEALMTLVLTVRFWSTYDYPPGKALGYAAFHAVQGFNNGGFALYPDSLVRFAGDPWICLPIAFGGIIGGLGFPALFEAVRRWRRPGHWTVATKLTIWGSVVLLIAGFVGFLLLEWSNPRTLGPFGWPQKLLAAFTQDAMIRTGGFSTVNIDALNEGSYPLFIGLMFIGGGSASTAGGIKVATFFLLAFCIWAEVRGDPDVVVGRRRVAEASQRQALTVALLSVALVVIGTFVMIVTTQDLQFYQALFQVVSAFSTTGLSLSPAATVPIPDQIVLIVLMYIGRIGTIAVGSAIALNTRPRHFRYPKEQPIVG